MKKWQALLFLTATPLLLAGVLLDTDIAWALTLVGAALLALAVLTSSFTLLQVFQKGDYFIDDDIFTGKKKS